MAGDLGGKAHGNTAGAIQQTERQARGQLARLFGGAVVVGNEVHRAHVDLVEQEAGDARQTRFGVTHGGGAVAIARAKVTLPVDQRVALREVLRHAHQRVVGSRVAVRVVTAQHIAHHTGTLNRLGGGVVVRAAVRQAHAVHRVQNAALHRLLAVAHVRQSAAFDDRKRVFKVSTLSVSSQVVAFGGGFVDRS